MIIHSNTHYYPLNSDTSLAGDFVSRKMKAVYAYLNPFAPEEPTINRIKKFHIEPSFGPAVWQFLYPPEFIRACYSLIEATKLENKELISDTKLNLLRIATGTLYSASYLLTLAIEVGFIFHRIIIPLVAPFVPAVGLVGSVICGFIEVKKAIRQVYFISECNEHLKSLKAGKVTPETLVFLKTFMPTDNSSETEKKLLNLADRMGLWFIEEFVEELGDMHCKMIQRLEHPRAPESHAKWLRRATRFIGHVKTQAIKKRNLQIISIAAIAILLLSFIATLMAQPYLIPAIIIVAYFTLLIGNYIHDSGTQRHLGWDFRPNECIPKCVKKFMGMQTVKPKESIYRKKYKVLSEAQKIALQRFSSGTLNTSRKLSSKDFTVG